MFLEPLPALAQAQAPMTFEVASVKPARSRFADASGQKGPGAAVTPTFAADHLTFRARSMTLYGLIVEAYGLRFCRPLAHSCPMLSDGPAWLTRDRFDIDAKGPAGSKEYDTIQLMKGAAPQLQEKLRNLLADRFHLKAHFEKRQLPVYAFTVAEGGVRMKKAAPGGPQLLIFKPVNSPGGAQATQVVARRSTVRELADLYARFMDRPVIDVTGLTDRFDFTVEYDADADSAGPFAAVTSPTLFRAFEKQAGLKLSATRGAVDVLVIDDAAHPAAN